MWWGARGWGAVPSREAVGAYSSSAAAVDLTRRAEALAGEAEDGGNRGGKAEIGGAAAQPPKRAKCLAAPSEIVDETR